VAIRAEGYGFGPQVLIRGLKLIRNYSGTPNEQHGGKRHTKSRSEICRPESFSSFVRQVKWRGSAWEKHKGENRKYFGMCPATGTYHVLEIYQKVHLAMINCQAIIFA